MALVQSKVCGVDGFPGNVILANALSVPGTGVAASTVNSTPHKIAKANNVGFYIQAASLSGGTINVKVYIQICYAIDETYANMEDIPLLITLSDNEPHPVGTMIPHNGYLRLQFIGETGNAADVTIDAIACIS
jgi:hypothetical protein